MRKGCWPSCWSANPNLRVYNPQPKPKNADAADAINDSGLDDDIAAVAEQARGGAAGPLERARGNSEERESPEPLRAGSAAEPAEAAPLLNAALAKYSGGQALRVRGAGAESDSDGGAPSAAAAAMPALAPVRKATRDRKAKQRDDNADEGCVGRASRAVFFAQT